MAASTKEVGASLRSAQFRRERSKSWVELARLISKTNSGKLDGLTAKEIARLPALYRHAVSSLSVARSISLDRALVEYLEALTAHAYTIVYRPKRPAIQVLLHFFSHGFPQAVRRNALCLLIATSVMCLGVMVGVIMVSNDAKEYYTFVDADMAGGRTPESTREELREVLYDEGGSDADLYFFAAFLFHHNAKIGLFCVILGVLAGLPVFWLMFTNGALLGAFIALYANHDLSGELMAWICPHGVTEILAILLCGASGLSIGRGMVFPGRHRRRDNLEFIGRDAGTIALGGVLMFFVAGLIEGIFRQRVTNVSVRWVVAGTTFAIWFVYLTFCGRKAKA